MSGPLAGVKVVEIAGLGPTPFAAMCLADMGAEVIRVARPGQAHLLGLDYDILNRGRGFIELDLKSADGRAVARRLIGRADALIEGMRPGAMERLGLGPDDFRDHPRLVYGRMTGWGQAGPLAQVAGHDITYLALTGVLHAIGPRAAPAVPLNLLGDFGGGGLYLAFGMLAALWHAARTGVGQVVDCAITDGVAHLAAMITAMQMAGQWSDRRAANLLDGAAPFYGVYECSCGGHLAVGAIEPRFWADFLGRIGLDPGEMPPQADVARWPEARARLARHIATRSRDDWAADLEGTDACAAPVLSLAEARAHPQNARRGTYARHEGVTQPMPAPRLSATPGELRPASQAVPLDPAEVLAAWQA